tara:strand:+ start:24 stop:383 length:360 start_codon:yes stop_codon:yes gene_type:complete
MLKKVSLIIILSLFVPSTLSFVYGHSKHHVTYPLNNSVVNYLPVTFSLKFEKKTYVSKYTVFLNGREIVNKRLENAIIFKHSFSFKDLLRNYGKYRVVWRALGMDGHIVKGEVFFEITK